MLLEQSYDGPPLLYDNPSLYNATNLVYSSSTKAEPNGTLYFPPGTNWVNMWFGPYTFLPPGNYTVEYTLRVTSALPASAPVIRLDVDYGNLVTVTKQVLTGSDFPGTGYEKFSLNFELKQPEFDVQFRGMYPTNTTGIYLESLSVIEDA
jgi:hypothetical protein